MTGLIDARPTQSKVCDQLELEDDETIVRLEEFLASLDSGTLGDRADRLRSNSDLIDGIRRALQGVYVHLAFKHSRYGSNPIERLHSLARQLEDLTDLGFYLSVLEVLRDLRDPHTAFYLPEPYKSAKAFLPFLLEAYWVHDGKERGESRTRRFVVTRIAPGFEVEGFEPGAEITHWNGMPMQFVMDQAAQRENGANPEARFAMAVASMTVRPLRFQMPPGTPTVTITFVPPTGKGDSPSELLVEWYVLQRKLAKKPGQAPAMNLRSSEVHGLRGRLFKVPSPKQEGFQELTAPELEDKVQYRLMDDLSDEIGPVKVGVIRIRSFDNPMSVTDITNLMERMYSEPPMPRTAPLVLLLDVRGNPGGRIPIGEELLQLFTPGTVTPAFFQYLNTELVRDLTEAQKKLNLSDDFTDYGLNQNTGALYSRAAQITPAQDANQMGQRYYGRVALITDAMCYSTTDIFAAGFQDHRIGPVIGVDASTGGGGANVWYYGDRLEGRNTGHGTMFPALPGGSDMGISVRQCLRVGRFHGDILEDFGVKPDHRYHLEKQDLLEGNKKLYRFAFSKLLGGAGLMKIDIDLEVRIPPLKKEEPAKADWPWNQIVIYFKTTGVQYCELLINDVVVRVFQALCEGYQGRHFEGWAAGMEQPSKVELKCYNIMPRTDFPFYTDEEKASMGKEAIHHLVASRKVFKSSAWESSFETSKTPAARVQSSTGPVKRGSVLFFVRGRGPDHALASLAIAEQLKIIRPDAEVQFVSYGTGAATLRKHGESPVDLDLPDHPGLFAVAGKIPGAFESFLEHSGGYLPSLIVTHEEFDAVDEPRRHGLKCIFLTDWFTDPGDWFMEKLRGADEVLFLDESIGIFPPEPPDLAARKGVHYVGPVLRPACYEQKRLIRPEAKREARRKAGLDQDALIVSVFLQRQRRVEIVAPLSPLLRKTSELLKERKFAGGMVQFLYSGQDFDEPDLEQYMAAADLAITRGNRTIVLELASMGVPTISVAHLLNFTDDLRIRMLDSNRTVEYAEVRENEGLLADLISEMIDKGQAGEIRPQEFHDGAREAATLLGQWLV